MTTNQIQCIFVELGSLLSCEMDERVHPTVALPQFFSLFGCSGSLHLVVPDRHHIGPSVLMVHLIEVRHLPLRTDGLTKVLDMQFEIFSGIGILFLETTDTLVEREPCVLVYGCSNQNVDLCGILKVGGA